MAMLLNSYSTQIFINSPLEQFEVTNLIGISAPILGYLNISLTNLGLYTILILFLIVGLHYYGNNEVKPYIVVGTTTRAALAEGTTVCMLYSLPSVCH